MDDIEEIRKQKDQAYWERNQLVAALSKIYPSWLEYNIVEEEGWRWVVFIKIPTKELAQKYEQGGFMCKHTRQLSWHISDSEMVNTFGHVKSRDSSHWDGHTTEEKYRRLSNIIKPWYWR